MTSKYQLKRKLRKQRIKGLLKSNDLKIELSNVKYALNFSELQAKYLGKENDRLTKMIERLQEDLLIEKTVSRMKHSVRDEIPVVEGEVVYESQTNGTIDPSN